MSRHHEEFDPECPGCRPCLVDFETKEVLPDTHPDMILLLDVWRAASKAEQEAFFRVTVHNSRDANDLRALQSLQQRIRVALDPESSN